MVAPRRFTSLSGVRLVFPQTRPDLVSPANGEPLMPERTYDPHVQADIAQVARARGTVLEYGSDAATAAAAAAAAGAAPGTAALTNVIQPSIYQKTAKVSFALTTVPVLALASTQARRVFLIVRNDSSSLGNVLVDFDNPNPISTQCSVVLVPGGIMWMDAFVAEGDLYLVSTSTAFAVVTYAIMAGG